MDNDIFTIFHLPVKVLKLAGLWTSKNASNAYKVYGVIMQLMFIDVYAFCMTMHLSEFEGLGDFAELMSLLPVYYSCVIKSINFMLNIDELEELFSLISECVREFDVTTEFRKQMKTVDRIYKIFWGGGVFINFNLMISTLSTQKLSVKMWLPFELDTPYKFWPIALHQNVDAFFVTGKHISLCFPSGLIILIKFSQLSTSRSIFFQFFSCATSLTC